MKERTGERLVASEWGEFIEDMGLAVESAGLPRVAGKLLGWLLICEPAEQSAAQMGEALQASSGSISTNIRLLNQFGLVERVGVRGARRNYYRLRPDAWISMMQAELSAADRWRSVADQGLEMLGDRDSDARQRLATMSRFFTFMHDELDAATGRYTAQKENRDD